MHVTKCCDDLKLFIRNSSSKIYLAIEFLTCTVDLAEQSQETISCKKYSVFFNFEVGVYITELVAGDSFWR
jgi:hypothetical protein